MLNKYDRQTARHKRLIHALTEKKMKSIFLSVRAAFQSLRRKHSHSKIVIITGLGDTLIHVTQVMSKRPNAYLKTLTYRMHTRFLYDINS